MASRYLHGNGDAPLAIHYGFAVALIFCLLQLQKVELNLVDAWLSYCGIRREGQSNQKAKPRTHASFIQEDAQGCTNSDTIERMIAALAVTITIPLMQSDPLLLPIGARGSVRVEPSQMISTRTGKTVTADDIAKAAADTRYVYVGESHDNPHHHQMQADVIAALVRAGRDVVVGMEMFTRPNQVNLAPWTMGMWTEEQFIARFRAGKVIQESHMPWLEFGRMSDTDLRAIYRYLRSVPPIENETGPLVQRK